MTPDAPNPASAAAPTGSGNALCFGAEEFPDSTRPQNPQDKFRNPRAIREAKRLLKLEFLHECAGGIAVHAGLVQTFAEIGDRAGVCYALRRLFAHAKAAHPVYVELRDEAASNEGRPS
jgi:hypothetical protein